MAIAVVACLYRRLLAAIAGAIFLNSEMWLKSTVASAIHTSLSAIEVTEAFGFGASPSRHRNSRHPSDDF